MRIFWLASILFICSVFSSCKRQTPQLPSNKVVVDNSDIKTLLAINENLAAREDSMLEVYVSKKDKELRKAELGFWYKVVRKVSSIKIDDKENCSFSYTLLLLNGKEVDKGRKQVVLGKKQIITGLEEGLKLIHHGDSAIFLIPWYLGYGMKGNESLVPAYTSIIYKIKVD
jgi:FKBP-type peptidyl-prolyl cis-trans isomerase FkpA